MSIIESRNRVFTPNYGDLTYILKERLQNLMYHYGNITIYWNVKGYGEDAFPLHDSRDINIIINTFDAFLYSGYKITYSYKVG